MAINKILTTFVKQTAVFFFFLHRNVQRINWLSLCGGLIRYCRVVAFL